MKRILEFLFFCLLAQVLCAGEHLSPVSILADYPGEDHSPVLQVRAWRFFEKKLNIREVIEHAVRFNRAMLYRRTERNVLKEPGSYLSCENLGGRCGPAMMDFRDLMLFLTQNDVGVTVNLHQAKHIFNGQLHVFAVVGFANKHYLVDTTFIQFLDLEVPEEILKVGMVLRRRMRESRTDRRIVTTLLRKGYIELDDQVANLYGNALAENLDFDGCYTALELILAEPTYENRVAESKVKTVTGIYGGNWMNRFDDEIATALEKPLAQAFWELDHLWGMNLAAGFPYGRAA
jgi:hypothetical protein